VLQPDIQGSYENIADGEDSIAAEDAAIAEDESATAEEHCDEASKSYSLETLMNDSQTAAADTSVTVENTVSTDEVIDRLNDTAAADATKMEESVSVGGSMLEDSILAEESLQASDSTAGVEHESMSVDEEHQKDETTKR
jgi:hypothetical protein